MAIRTVQKEKAGSRLSSQLRAKNEGYRSRFSMVRGIRPRKFRASNEEWEEDEDEHDEGKEGDTGLRRDEDFWWKEVFLSGGGAIIWGS